MQGNMFRQVNSISSFHKIGCLMTLDRVGFLVFFQTLD